MLPLPLNRYDESGRVLPPMGLWLVLAYLAKSLIIIIGATLFNEHTDRLLKLIYPSSDILLYSLLGIVPALWVWVFVAYRQKLWERDKYKWVKWIKPVLYFSICFEVGFSLFNIALQHGMFNWWHGLNIVLAFWACLWLGKSKHISLLVKDWQEK
ncbi:DUF2919 domain-containing protein [Aestuariibacter sp. AA17]|uniref:DUF2919 domain-containing protein n=1 Tax=Fluctibacter corallii TaxID=2984329 RepID=A0ABT3A9C3_9ALTE|nr:DUF2919 domain-containing protein [Aestuariibacter sp. AA17]MCV2885282.1 DUF2919 domain-containing protein [Aestuariibacter sp. AA17]